MNIPAIHCALRTLHTPSLCLPHATIPTLAHLPIPISRLFASGGQKEPDIRAVILDKDNTFALPNANTIDPTCKTIIAQLLAHYGPKNLLIVSNTAGLASKDPQGKDAALLEEEIGIPVLLHTVPKPGPECGQAALQHFRDRGVDVKPEQIAVVGDRLFTDIVMAKGIGAWAVWVKEGVKVDTGLWTRGEWALECYLRRRGLFAPRLR